MRLVVYRKHVYMTWRRASQRASRASHNARCKFEPFATRTGCMGQVFLQALATMSSFQRVKWFLEVPRVTYRTWEYRKSRLRNAVMSCLHGFETFTWIWNILFERNAIWIDLETMLQHWPCHGAAHFSIYEIEAFTQSAMCSNVSQNCVASRSPD